MPSRQGCRRRRLQEDLRDCRGPARRQLRGGHAARCSACWAPTGPARRRRSNILSTLTRRTAGARESPATTSCRDPAGVRRSIMLTGQHVALDDLLTGRENLVMFGRLQGLRKKAARQRAEELLEQFDLVDAGDRAVGTYSGGMRRRIDIACGLVVRPEVVFLDEPTTGLDPRSRQAIWELVTDFKEAGIATLLTTQYLEEADAAQRPHHRDRPGHGHRRGHRRPAQGAHRRRPTARSSRATSRHPAGRAGARAAAARRSTGRR